MSQSQDTFKPSRPSHGTTYRLPFHFHRATLTDKAVSGFNCKTLLPNDPPDSARVWDFAESLTAHPDLSQASRTDSTLASKITMAAAGLHELFPEITVTSVDAIPQDGRRVQAYYITVELSDTDASYARVDDAGSSRWHIHTGPHPLRRRRHP